MIVRHERGRSRPGPDRPPQFDCGHVHIGLTLSDREWSCVECGVIHDRDRNAVINFDELRREFRGDSLSRGRR
jgi:hypothetical protein